MCSVGRARCDDGLRSALVSRANVRDVFRHPLAPLALQSPDPANRYDAIRGRAGYNRVDVASGVRAEFFEQEETEGTERAECVTLSA